MPAFRLVLRGLWWRKGLNSAVLAVAVLTTTAAALGPLYARAAGESTLNDHLTQATWRAGIHVSGVADIGRPGVWSRLAKAAPAPGRVHGYDRVIAGIRTTQDVGVTNVPGRVEFGLAASVFWRQGACAHVVIVRGHCPNAPGEALASARTLDPLSDEALYLGPHRWRLGTRLAVGPFANPYEADLPSTGTSVRIVGTYRPKNTDDPFWFGHNYFDAQAGNASTSNAPVPPTVDALLVAKSTMLSIRGDAYVATDFDYPLTPAKVRLHNQDSVRAAVARLTAHRVGGSTLIAESGLGRALDADARDRQLVDTGTLLVILQLGLLALLVLFQVVADAIEARGNEIAMAKLRGHTPLATLRFGLSEPLLLLAMAVPLGILAAWGLTHAFAAGVLAAGSPVVLTRAPLVAALVAFGGGVLAAVSAGYTTLTRPVLDQWRRTTRRPGHGRLALALDVVVAAAAVAALVLLLREPHRGHPHSTPLLTPGLLVLAVALLGVRLLPLACRRLASRTRASRRVGTFLASRQVARRPIGLRLAALLAVAVGLAMFAVAGESVATANRRARAGAELGAARVASVQYEPGHDPVEATQRADPHGRWAMAAATWLPDGGVSVLGTVLGVDTSRLGAVGQHVPGGPPPDQLATGAGGSPMPPITTTATAIRVHLTATGLTGGSPRLRVDLHTPGNPYAYAYSTPIRDGTGTYQAALSCPKGCTLRGLTWDRPVTAVRPMSGTIVMSGIEFGSRGRWTPVDIRSGTLGSWRAAVPQGQATDRVAPSQHGVRDEFGNSNGGYGGIVYASDLSPIPAVANPAALDGGKQHGAITDAVGTTVAFQVVREVRVLPAVLTDGVAMDVRYLEAQLPAFADEANWQVWLGSHAPADAVARLRAAGLQVQSVRTMSGREDQLGRQGPALALLLLLACAAAGAVLAVGATATSISASSRRRSYEIAALRAVGVSRRALLRAGLVEQLLLLGTGVALGVPTGLVAARLAMPVIPEFSDRTPITLDYAPHALPAAIMAATFVVLLTVAAVIAARALIGAAVPARLREAEG